MNTVHALTDPDLAYVRQAFIAAAAVGLVCSLLSVMVVLKRMAFIGQGISHAGFGGIGTATLLGLTGSATAWAWRQDLVVLAFCLATAVVIGLLSRRRRVEADAAIGILLAATMAWGIIAQNLRFVLNDWPAYRAWAGPLEYAPSWEAILFGSILNVGSHGMWAAIVMGVIVLGVGALKFRQLVAFAFDETVSRTLGIRTTLLYFTLLVMLAIVVVVSIRLLGLILVSALLIMPGAAAMLISRRLSSVLVIAAATGVIGTLGGLVVSLEVGRLSTGACIVMVLFVLFLIAYALSPLRRAAPPAPG